MHKIAVIPARGGSKRIPRKNLKKFLGTPTIVRTLALLAEFNLFDEIVVSTDDTEIRNLALRSGASFVIDRNTILANDFTPTVPVVADALTQLDSIRLSSTSESVAVCCVYPVNPFLDLSDLRKGLDALVNNREIDYVNPISSYPYPIQRSLRLLPDERIELTNPDLMTTRSQDLEEMYHDAGQWYWGRASTWISGRNLLQNSIGVKVDRWKVQDIDTLEDWKYAEKLYLLLNR